MNPLDSLVASIERFDRLDGVSAALAGVVGKAVQPRVVRNVLSGTLIGHPVHPLLTDLPIGAWSMAALLDTLGGETMKPAADLLVAVGIAAAVPTAAAGLNDWSDTQGKPRRVGLVHAAANSAALGLYAASGVARSKGSRGLGKTLGLAGFGILMVGGFLGGHLSYANGVNVNRTANRTGPAKWTPVLDDAELPDGGHRKVEAGKVSVLLYRSGSRILAVDSVCSHMGGPLEQGEIDGGCVVCPWHGSTFRLKDGSVVRGPATRPQPRYETRLNEGRIEVRRTPG
ncbi:Rieske (2Fe-2S) protein [Arthrobacter sp. Soil763]|uniref:Rieske (2Fe-2S) protein n=1 Tax=Arthrobacter sp. Soil763 TaxID=1736402 RepID=UPI0006F782B7|nr:Rieske (2Fe-2S) protein [Arthrobacter sp. Soil763]KRE81602.1 iron-sulfur protein [Arthrobacter sp. Soil763]